MSGDNLASQDPGQDLASHFNWTRAAKCSPNKYFRKPHELPSFTNNKDPDEMLPYSAFRRSLDCLLIQKDNRSKIQFFFEKL